MNATLSSVFWSVIDAGGAGVRAGPLPEGLWPLLEEEVPIATEQLWAVGVPVDDGRFAVCAVRRSDLDSIEPGTLRLTPASVPEFIPVDADRFNLLVGAFEPGPLRRARLRLNIAAAASVLIAASLIAVGLSRRAASWQTESLAARQATQTIIASVSPPISPPHWTGDDLALELQQRRHVDGEAGRGGPTPPADAARALAALIARWPTQVPSKTQSIAATGQAASVSVTVPPPGDAAPFLEALKPPEGWTLEEPRLNAVDKVTRLTLEFRKEGTQ